MSVTIKDYVYLLTLLPFLGISIFLFIENHKHALKQADRNASVQILIEYQLVHAIKMDTLDEYLAGLDILKEKYPLDFVNKFVNKTHEINEQQD